MSVLIKNGRIITAVDDYLGDVFIENETVSLIGKSLEMEADEIIDASGKYTHTQTHTDNTHTDNTDNTHTDNTDNTHKQQIQSTDTNSRY